MQQKLRNRRQKIFNEFLPFSVVIWQFLEGIDLPIKIDPHHHQKIGSSYLGQTKEISSKNRIAIWKHMSELWHSHRLKIIGVQKFGYFFHGF